MSFHGEGRKEAQQGLRESDEGCVWLDEESHMYHLWFDHQEARLIPSPKGSNGLTWLYKSVNCTREESEILDSWVSVP